ncbi:MAG: ABC transporter permease [Candidatus Micrarchaeia archaeon]
MQLNDLVLLALKSLRARRLRSWLAILGIVIGVAAIISLISVSIGANENIQKNIRGLGANIITISPGNIRAQRFVFGVGGGGGGGVGQSEIKPITFKEADELRKIEGIEAIDARVQSNARVVFKNMNRSMTIVGTEAHAFPKSTGATLLEGRAFEVGDRKVAVLGYSVAYETFNESMLGMQIKIRDAAFRVIGILNKTGGMGGPDTSIFIPQKDARDLFNITQPSSLVVIAADGYDPEVVASEVAAELRALHRIESEDEQDFRVITAATIQSTISSVTMTLSLFLGGIAAISLIVGGIGVANAMFTSVLEQTKYIGILKSLGATDSDILLLFLVESGVIGLVGGILGIALSFISSSILHYFSIPSIITSELVLLGVGFSFIVGVLSGLMPARNAALVEPVEALRYE